MTRELEPKAGGAVRIVTWNVAAGFANKVHRIADELDADIAVVCEACNEGRLRKAGSTDFRSMDWIGRSQSRGLAVMGFGSWNTSMYESVWDQRLEWALPTKATGPARQSFNVIGCWAFNKRAHHDPTDFQQSQGTQIPALYPSLVAGPTVIAGDFNSNLIWDKPGKTTNWQQTLDAMDNIGLASAYHSFFGEDQGTETSPTHWWKRSTDTTFHIDYCFVPTSWDITQVWVGGPEAWLRKGDGSDHAPLVVDVVPNANDAKEPMGTT